MTYKPKAAALTATAPAALTGTTDGTADGLLQSQESVYNNARHNNNNEEFKSQINRLVARVAELEANLQAAGYLS